MNYVTILTHNRADQLKHLIDAPCFALALPAHILILNQGSTDGTAQILNTWAAGRLTVNAWNASQNAGIIAGHQRQVDWLTGYGLIDGDIVVFLDDDVYPMTAGWLKRLTEPFSDPTVGIVGCYGAHVSANWDMIQATEPGEVDFVNMSHTAARAEIFLNGFEFPLHFGVCWHEDAALCLWAKEHGYTVQYVGTPESIGLHHDPHHKETDDLYFKNWAMLKAQYQGKGLVKGERNG